MRLFACSNFFLMRIARSVFMRTPLSFEPLKLTPITRPAFSKFNKSNSPTPMPVLSMAVRAVMRTIGFSRLACSGNGMA